MASEEQVVMGVSHRPTQLSINAFERCLPDIIADIERSRKEWRHIDGVWPHVPGLSDQELTRHIHILTHLKEVRVAELTYGKAIFGKIELPGVNDPELGQGYVHVRLHHGVGTSEESITFHSIRITGFDVGPDGHAHHWHAIQAGDTPLEWFDAEKDATASAE
ncbi:hypothetical protein BJ138DRAFT_1177889 [Hygrophoropsis aurantiaca]|uniref:Uncharacterized protein n=1 Tax=Hygrophoropsis aurantiaca TaxID=72124 RepID=A0ACB8AJY3_9AGAM|nr:hypothetical protein BJ138DRAFT_1177889 [Hygrophoropsis aurantiaca]